MVVHFFTRADVRSPDSRQRVFQVVDRLNARGITSVIHWPPAMLITETRWPKKIVLIAAVIRSLFSIRKGDIVYLQRTIVNKYFCVIMVLYLKIFKRKMIFDFCDPIYVHSLFKTKVFTRMANAVIVSSHVQEIWAKQFNDHVHLIHVSIDSSTYKKFTKVYSDSNKPLVIGWIGTAPNHFFNLEILASVFKKLLKKTDIPFTFILIGAFKDPKVYRLFQSIPGLNVQFIDKLDYSDSESIPREIHTFDIGVVPQHNDSPWNQGKTSMKVLEYMACAVPAVVSAFGEMPYVIQNGVDGFIAASEDEWVEKLTLLLKDSVLRERLGRAGQQTFSDRYSFDATMPQVVQVINSL